jgi:hypothetical protein
LHFYIILAQAVRCSETIAVVTSPLHSLTPGWGFECNRPLTLITFGERGNPLYHLEKAMRESSPLPFTLFTNSMIPPALHPYRNLPPAEAGSDSYLHPTQHSASLHAGLS